MRKSSIQFAALGILFFCAWLDFASIHTLSLAPCLGARFRNVKGTVLAVEVAPNSAPARAGLRKGDVLESIDGQPILPLAHSSDAYDFVTSADQNTFWDGQKTFNRLVEQDHTTLVFRQNGQRHTVDAHFYPLGWRMAWRWSLPLHFVGWSYLLISLLLWIKKQGALSSTNLLVAVGVCVACSTAPCYLFRELCLPTKAFHVLAFLNYMGCLTAILALRLVWFMPSPARCLRRLPSLRFAPWILTTIMLVMIVGNLHPFHLHWFYIFSTFSVSCLIALTLLGMIQATQPLLKAQMKWITLGISGGFLPWVLFSELPMAFGIRPVPVEYTLLFVVITPICIALAVLRYRLLDVGQIFDWVMVHIVILGIFLAFEFGLWFWLGSRYAPRGTLQPFLIAISMCVVVFFYAPLRTWLLCLLAKRAGHIRPTLAEALHKLLERTQQTENPREALEQTLRWSLAPSRLKWISSTPEYAEIFRQLAQTDNGVFGCDFKAGCDPALEGAAWIPVQTGNGLAALVLEPTGSAAWSRQDLRMARALACSCEPLFEIRRIQQERQRAETALRQQREELIRELHDGLGSQLFGASLLSNQPPQVSLENLQRRMSEIHAAMVEAIDTLRAGLTVLNVPPGAFGPALLALLMRMEKVFNAAGIKLRTEIADEATSLQLGSRHVFALLRALQEAFTNACRHSGAKQVWLQVVLFKKTLILTVRDDGCGFDLQNAPRGHGLNSMRDRLHLIGGETRMLSAPAQGCCVEFSLPTGKSNCQKR